MKPVRIERHIAPRAALGVVEAGLAAGTELGLQVAIVVTDTAGGLVAGLRMDGAGADTVAQAQAKATVAARMGRSTAEFIEMRLSQDEVLWRAMTATPGSFFAPGGQPLVLDGVSVGGVGVSGGDDGDDAVALAAARSFG